MKSLQMSSLPSSPPSTTVRRPRPAWAWLTAGVLALACLFTPRIGTTAEPEPSFVSGVLDLPLSNYYLTPRGLIVENAGVIAQPSLFLNFNLYQGEDFINGVTGTVGIWNSIHSKQRDVRDPLTGNLIPSTTPHWNEMDLISAVSVTFLKNWTFTFDYEYWVYPGDSSVSQSHVEMKLAYSDHFLKGLLPLLPGELSINPYVNIFVELKNKTVVASTDESYYFELGFAPTYVFDGYPLTIALPTYLLFPGDHFYDENSTLGVFGTGVRVTAPLTFIRPRYGKWSVHTDLIYKHLVNDSIVAGNIFGLPPHAGTRNPVQIVAGLTLNF